jgi:hypothetical protein
MHATNETISAPPSPASLLQYSALCVLDWKRSKKVAMTRKNVQRCAKDLGLSTAAVRDAMNAAGIEYKFG